MGFFKSSQMIDGYNELKEGMTKEEVILLLGEPDGQKKRDGIETLIWHSSEFKGWARGGNIERTIEVDFENGEVCGWDGQNLGVSRW